ncbi:MAG: NTP transferase domain-containing protein [Ignavibacteria bacterium]|jgi:bifunctional UDP-N-acetylglucosamine pyrophosphorylase/glucosamine-1-phosphate N-acetyltransferase
MNNISEIHRAITENSSSFDGEKKDTAIILAAGHGKRIKSNTSKMLHKLWGITTVERVYNSCKSGLTNPNSIIVVGIKALEVINSIGKKENNSFAYQSEQNGTGHAVQVGLEKIPDPNYDGNVYVLPGDMGLIDDTTLKMFKSEFENSQNDMMVLTGMFKGNILENYYGRIIRVKEFDDEGRISGEDCNKVIEILEYKDILSLKADEKRELEYNGRKYSYTKKELLENREFNSGVFAYKYNYLVELIHKIESNNIQKEIYLTDLIDLFNKEGLNVGAIAPEEDHIIMGFNNKSVLKEMEEIAKSLAYNKIKDLIYIEDPNDFYIHENVIEQLIQMDKKGLPLDIQIGKGVSIGKGVKPNYGLSTGRNTKLNGSIELGMNIKIADNSVIDGDVKIGDNVLIGRNISILGNCDIGCNVKISGLSEIRNSKIDDEVNIEHSILINKRVKREIDFNGNVIRVRFYLPQIEGNDLIIDKD